MTTTTSFSLQIRDDNVGVITMDIAGESMNVLKAAFADEITALLADIKANSQLKGLVFISGKSDSFIAGADISMLDNCNTAAEAEAIGRMGQQMFDQLEQLSIPLVAAIHGPCLGGGLELAMACHARVATSDSKTVLGLPEVQLGLLPGSGGTQRLPKLVGLQKALDMILTGKQLRAAQAKKAGLVDEVVPQSILLEAAVKRVLKGKPQRSAVKLNLVGKVLERTPFGRNVYAVGGSEHSAVLMGLPVRRTLIGVYTLSGFCSALAGVVFTFYMLSGYGLHAVGMELDAIAAVVIGGTLLTGGVGYVAGTLFGVLMLGIIQTLISFDGTLSSWWTRIVVGVLLFAFCLLQRLLSRRSGKAR